MQNKLIFGKTYSNAEIAEIFGCSPQGGMRRSHKTNTLVLLAKHHRALYNDQWTEDGILYYTGEGKRGNQKLNKQNKTLANSNESDINVFLFESFEDNIYYFSGEVYLAEKWYEDQELDELFEMRKVFKFPLKRKTANNLIISEDILIKCEKQKNKKISLLPLKTVKALAKKNGSKISKRQALATNYYRDPYVADYTKRRAKGICDLCNLQAPFKNKLGEDYLEEHHVKMLSQGGPDEIYNTVALCPNCHRQIHINKDITDQKKLQKKIKEYLKEDKDEISLKKYKQLFHK